MSHNLHLPATSRGQKHMHHCNFQFISPIIIIIIIKKYSTDVVRSYKNSIAFKDATKRTCSPLFTEGRATIAPDDRAVKNTYTYSVSSGAVSLRMFSEHEASVWPSCKHRHEWSLCVKNWPAVGSSYLLSAFMGCDVQPVTWLLWL